MLVQHRVERLLDQTPRGGVSAHRRAYLSSNLHRLPSRLLHVEADASDRRRRRRAALRGQSALDLVAREVGALDEFLPRVERLSLVKCDVEGAELLAFRGAERLIGEHLPTVICEINPWFLEGFQIRLEELLGFFFGRGYQLYHYRQEGAGRGRLSEVPAEDVVEDNYVFVHPSRVDRLAAVLG
ncbi:MAG TPA: FkbM family methyltransferase [Pyrinomonadaceae bacterium]|nr:FkbM family methyltransferase [Pyrinomonadaceae bacterium]